jgi:hypothetical protein
MKGTGLPVILWQHCHPTRCQGSMYISAVKYGNWIYICMEIRLKADVL